METLRVGSLFAGIGGFDLAAERAGMTVAWQSEIDKHASQVLAHHWPEVPNYGDIHDIRVRRTEPAAMARSGRDGADRSGLVGLHLPNEGDDTHAGTPPGVDVLTGGFPCQDYSVAGNRGGLAGDRGALWWEYHRLITGLRPTWVVGENVPGLLSSRDGADFETIVGSLTECGYGVAWAVLDAQYFGVAQRRRRVFIVGHSGGVPRPEVLALSQGLFGHPEPRRATREAVAAGVGAFAQNQRDEVRDLGDQAGALAAEPGMKQQTYVIEPETGQGADLKARPTDRAPSLSALNGQMHDRGVRIVSSANPAVRRLTPLECERLQGFPDGWTDIPGNSDTQRYRQLGNAVAVPVAEWILKRIVEVR